MLLTKVRKKQNPDGEREGEGGRERKEEREGENYSESLKDRLTIRLNIGMEMILFLIVAHLNGHLLQNVAVDVVVRSLGHPGLFVTLWTAAHQIPLSSTISWSLLKFMSVELVDAI